MAFLRLFITLLLMSPVLASGSELTIVREQGNHFPRCVENFEGKNLLFKWNRRTLTRGVKYSFTHRPCFEWKKSQTLRWKELSPELKSRLPEELRFELEQIALKATEFRVEKTAAEFIDKRNITEFTRELNRELTPKFGPIFSAEVFKELVERKSGNREFRNYVLSFLKQEGITDQPRPKVTLVVSFGLGWSNEYGIAAPYYIKDFLSDIESLGLEVVYLRKNPFGTIKNNVRRIIPQLEDELKKDKNVILLSLCKGTPEIFSALAEIQDPELKKKIIGHVNLSGMLTGTFFADITMSVLIPKLLSPFLKIIPIREMRDAGKMASSTSYMKSSIIAESLNTVKGKIPEGILTVNVTGAPLSDRIMRNGSPMAPILKYNSWQRFLVSATDGFIELPHTQVPEDLASNQVSLVLDASHMLSDGYLDEFELKDRNNRRKLYQSILSYILK